MSSSIVWENHDLLCILVRGNLDSVSLSLSSQKLWIKEVGSDVAVLRVDISVERLMTTISSVAGSSLPPTRFCLSHHRD